MGGGGTFRREELSTETCPAMKLLNRRDCESPFDMPASRSFNFVSKICLSNRGYWCGEEEECLRKGVQKHGIGAWERIRHDPEFKILKCDK